jgi:hypothetical protein
MVWGMGTNIWRNQQPVSCCVAFYHKHGGSSLFQIFVPIYRSARCRNPENIYRRENRYFSYIRDVTTEVELMYL